MPLTTRKKKITRPEPKPEPNTGGVTWADLSTDIFIVVVASLPPDQVLALGCVCKDFVEVCRADQLWLWHHRDLASEHPNITLGRDSLDRPYEHYLKFKNVAEEHAAIEVIHCLCHTRRAHIRVYSTAIQVCCDGSSGASL